MKITLDHIDLRNIFNDALERFKSEAPLPGIDSQLQMVSRVLLAYHDFAAKHGLAIDLALPTTKPYESLED